MVCITPAGLVLLACCGGCLAAPAADAAEKPAGRIEFRRAEHQPAEGLIEAEVPGSERKVYLHPDAAMSNQEIERIRVVRDTQGQPAIEIAFTADGGKKMARLSQQQIGKPIAILVDGRVLTAPTVRARLSRKALITGNFTLDEVERLVETIRNHGQP